MSIYFDEHGAFKMIKPQSIQQWMDLAWERIQDDREQAIVCAVNGLTTAVQQLIELLPTPRDEET